MIGVGRRGCPALSFRDDRGGVLVAGLDLLEAIAQAGAQLLGRVIRLRAAVARDDGAGGGDARDPGQAQQLPTRLHGSRRLPAVTESELPFDEAIATAATGDIWLFRGRSFA